MTERESRALRDFVDLGESEAGGVICAPGEDRIGTWCEDDEGGGIEAARGEREGTAALPGLLDIGTIAPVVVGGDDLSAAHQGELRIGECAAHAKRGERRASNPEEKCLRLGAGDDEAGNGDIVARADAGAVGNVDEGGIGTKGEGLAEHEVIGGDDIERGGVDIARGEGEIAVGDTDAGDALAIGEGDAKEREPIVGDGSERGTCRWHRKTRGTW